MSAPILQITQDFLARLSGVQKAGDLSWQSICPAHADKTPSLTITQRPGRVVLHCHAGCTNREIVTALGTDFRALYQNDSRTPNIAPTQPWAQSVPVAQSVTDGDGDTETSRRIRQAARLYHGLKDLAPTKDVTDYHDARGVDIDIATAYGARYSAIPRADLQNKAPAGWVKGEVADAIVWPIYRAETILKSHKILSGIQREWPWGRQGGPRSVKAILGKHFLDRRAGGFLIGSLEGAHTLYIVEGPGTGIAVHKSTGQPVLVLISEGGLRNIAPATIADIRDSGLSVCICGDSDINGVGQKAAQICAQKILLTAPDIKVSISIPTGSDQDWLDVLNACGLEETSRLILANSTPPTLPTGPRGGQPHDDEYATPDLSGGPLGPEPPPIDYPGDRVRNVLPFIPWRETPRTTVEALPTLQETQDRLREALPGAIEAARAGRPVLISTITGSGKTHATLKAILAAQVNDGDKTRRLNFLWASATKDLAADACAVADAANAGRMISWDGRQTPGLCDVPIVTQALIDRGRSPHQHACQTCPHGVRPEGDAPDERCQFQINLGGAPGARGIFGQHGIVGRESTLMKHTADPRDDFADRDLMVLDEGIPTFSTTEITSADVSAARVAAGAIYEHVRGLRERNLQKQKRRGKVEDEPRFTEEDYAKALAWGHEIAPALDKLGATLVSGAGKGIGLHQIDKLEHAEFVRLGQKIPKAAQVLDASALEKVIGVFGQDPIIPLAWIKSLSKSIESGTAWLRVQERGADIIGTNPADLWTRFLTKGGILLDATCTHADEILAAGGLVIDLQAAQPHLHVAQYGPRLHGKGDSGRSADGRKKLAQEARDLRAAMGNDPDVVVITHKALADRMRDDRVRHWGTHKGHNDWKGKRRLILWGLPLMNAHDQIIGYKTYRAAMAAHGIDLPDWDGERSREWVQTDSWEIMPAAGLPSVKEARDWLLREMAADVAQAIGRLRAVWATESIQVEVYGFLPIVGFGLRVDEMRLERSGRAHRKTTTRKLVSEAIVDLGEGLTRKGVSDYVYNQGGGRLSNGTIDCIMDEVRAYALRHGMTLIEAARALCQITSDLLKEHNGDAMAAALAADAAGIPGAALLGLVIHQGRTQASGAQRAGP